MSNSFKSLTVVFILSFILIIFVLFFSFMLLYTHKINEYEENTYSYVISHYNTLSNKTTFGFAKMNSKIFRDEEFITFRSNEIFSVITSKFSNEEFECYGTCSCNNNNQERRTTPNILSKSLYFIISAFTLSFAVKIATDYFSGECSLSLKNICSEGNIETEINFCESSESEKGEVEKLEEEKYEGFEREYHCEGHCTPNRKLLRPETQRARKIFECQKYTTQARVVIIETAKLGFIGSEKYKGDSKARNRFMKDHLIPYCRSVSKWNYEYVYVHPNGNSERMKKRVSLCVGTLTGSKLYGNICCSLVDPFTTQDGVRERKRISNKLKHKL